MILGLMSINVDHFDALERTENRKVDDYWNVGRVKDRPAFFRALKVQGSVGRLLYPR